MPQSLKNQFGFVRGQSEEDRLLLILEMWRKCKPQAYEAYQRHIELVSACLRRESGMSDGKLFRYRSEIPTELYIVIRRFMPGFLDKPENMLKLEKLLMGKHLKLPKPQPSETWRMYEPDAASEEDETGSQGIELPAEEAQGAGEVPAEGTD